MTECRTTGVADEPAALTSQPSDEEILDRVSVGDSSALGLLYDRYGSLAYALAQRMLADSGAAEDVVQEVFLAVWRNARSYQSTRGQVRSWLLTAVRNRCIDLLRGPRHRLEVDDVSGVAEAVASDDVWESVKDRLEAQDVQRALASLPEDQRQTIHLAYFKGLTHSEIAVQLNLPLGTVKGRLRLGLNRLRDALGDLQPGGAPHEVST